MPTCKAAYSTFAHFLLEPGKAGSWHRGSERAEGKWNGAGGRRGEVGHVGKLAWEEGWSQDPALGEQVERSWPQSP